MTHAPRPDTSAQREATENARRMHLLVTIGSAVLSALAYVLVVLFTRADLPGVMATHFGVSGRADGFMSTPVALLIQGGMIIGVPVALLVVFGASEWWRGEGSRQISALLVGLSVGLAALFVFITLRHVGVEDPAMVTIDWLFGVVFIGIAAAAGVVAALLLPPALPRPATAPVEPLRITANDRVSWFGRATTSRPVVIAIAVAIVAVAFAAQVTNMWWLWLLVLLLIVVMLAVTSFNVSVNAHGLAWRSALGFPRGSVPLKDIESVAIVQVGPGDFGGFGLRAMPGRLGLITRSGTALRLEHRTGALVATIDDAVTAASVIEGLRLNERR